MHERVKVALVGISGYGASYLDALLNGPAVAGAAVPFELVAAVDPEPQRSRLIDALRSHGVPIYADLSDLLNSERAIDLTVISTPIHLHASQTCAALRAGSSVLCEKPLAGSLRDARVVVEASAAAVAPGAFVAIGYQWSFSRAVQALKRDVMAGRFGRPIRARTWAAFPRERSYFTRNAWAGRVRTSAGADVFDGPVNNATAHHLHNMLYVLGPTRERGAIPATLRAELYRANDVENYDTAALRCVTADGAELLFYTTHATTKRRVHTIFEFERGTVVYNEDSARTFTARFDNGRTVDYGDPDEDRTAKLWQSIAAVRTGGRTVACGPAGALPHVMCVTAMHASVEEVVDFPKRIVRAMPALNGSMLVVDGLDEALGECFLRGRLPAELGTLPWAQAGVEVRADGAAVPVAVESDEPAARPVAMPA